MNYPPAFEELFLLQQQHLLRLNRNDEGDMEYNNSKCLITMHGTCWELPFHHGGLAFVSLFCITFVLLSVLMNRMALREINAPYHYSMYSEWHCVLGRLGLLLFLFSCLLNFGRLWFGSFDVAWPNYITSMPIENQITKVTLANEQWAAHEYMGAGIEVFFWWYCCFLQTLIVPLTLYSMTFLIWKARVRQERVLHFLLMRRRGGTINHRNRLVMEQQHQAESKKWFLGTTVIVTFLWLTTISIFFIRIAHAPLKLIQVNGVWSLTTTAPVAGTMLQLGVIAWQGSLTMLCFVLLGIQWYYRHYHDQIVPNRGHNIAQPTMTTKILYYVCVITNSLALVFLLQWSDEFPVTTMLLQQCSIASQLYLDIIHNPDDYGRLHDETMTMLLPNHHQQQQQERIDDTLEALRQPLLSQSNENDQGENIAEVEEAEESTEERGQSEDSMMLVPISPNHDDESEMLLHDEASTQENIQLSQYADV